MQAALPADAERQAMIKGVQWYINGLLLPTEQRVQALSAGDTAVPPGTVTGQGQLGVLEGFSSDVDVDGTNPQATNFRDDCTAESSGRFVLLIRRR